MKCPGEAATLAKSTNTIRAADVATTRKNKPEPKGSGDKSSESADWSGALAQRLPRGEPPPRGVTSVLGHAADEHSLAAERHGWAVRTALVDAATAAPKMLLLLDHYGIERSEPERWFVLALRLAMDHVPGFQAEVPRGRPHEWSSTKLALLRLAIDQKLHERKPAGRPRTVHNAASIVAADSRFARVFDRCPSAKTLENRYRDALKDGLASGFSYLAERGHAESRAELVDVLLNFLDPPGKSPGKS